MDRVENRFGSNIRWNLSFGLLCIVMLWTLSISFLTLPPIHDTNDPAAEFKQMSSIFGLIIFHYIVLIGKLNHIYFATFHCELELKSLILCYFLSFIHIVREEMLRNIRLQKIKDTNLNAVAGAVVKSNEGPHDTGVDTMNQC